MRQKRQNNPAIAALALLACVLFIQAPGVALCDDTVKPETVKQETVNPETAKPEVKPYTYDAEGKPDPFNPFIDVNKKLEEEKNKKKKPAKAAAATVTKPENLQFLPPLQRYGIEEFKLVAIGGSDSNRVALVKDSKGKSYRLTQNTKIGMNKGKVVEIRHNQVI
ncbi:MAG: pilus assembly protein PilP, partial [Syntrophaceae bacterium]|nr:pilus assembly protein PilP [Syntrophaceae bacterium]